MAEQTTQPSSELDRAAEEAGFYHEAALNAAWSGSRIALGALSFLYGAFVFAYFYLRSINSSGRWHGSGYHPPPMAMGTVIMALVVVSAVVQYVALQRIKGGAKAAWQAGAAVALLLGLAAVALQIIELLNLPFPPGSSGFASVFTGFYPVILVSWLGAMIWLEILLMRARPLPGISFVEQPPTYAEAFAVQRFQSSLSAFTLVWNYLAVVTVFFWVLFYLL
jgi:heme/copper-type cytochrome/quinol oxidase subunit 3